MFEYGEIINVPHNSRSPVCVFSWISIEKYLDCWKAAGFKWYSLWFNVPTQSQSSGLVLRKCHRWLQPWGRRGRRLLLCRALLRKCFQKVKGKMDKWATDCSARVSTVWIQELSGSITEFCAMDFLQDFFFVLLFVFVSQIFTSWQSKHWWSHYLIDKIKWNPCFL